MPLKFAPVCKVCGERKTSHPSGLCSRCRRRPINQRVPCKICGTVSSNSPDGICGLCRNALGDSENFDKRIDDVIETMKERIFILEQRKDGQPFSKIAEMLGKSKSVVYESYKRSLNLKAVSGGYDSVDGSYIPAPFEEAAEMDIAAAPSRQKKKDAK